MTTSITLSITTALKIEAMIAMGPSMIETKNGWEIPTKQKKETG